jgi:hypothetical protein
MFHGGEAYWTIGSRRPRQHGATLQRIEGSQIGESECYPRNVFAVRQFSAAKEGQTTEAHPCMG